MKSQLPALMMLLSEFRKPIQVTDSATKRAIQPSRSFGIDPTPSVGEAGGSTPPVSRGAPWARSKKKRFG